MRRETRFNLVFLVVFLALSMPGAIILFRKKLDPSASRMDQPDAVLTQLPYMVPPPAPPGIRWMVPPKTRAWLAELTRQRAETPMLSSVPPGPDWEPVISGDHTLQVVATRTSPDATIIDALLWSGEWPAIAADYRLTLRSGEAKTEANLQSVDGIAIPPEVRKELVSLGYIHPPKQAHWLRATLRWKLSAGERVTLDVADTAVPARQTSASWTVE